MRALTYLPSSDFYSAEFQRLICCIFKKKLGIIALFATLFIASNYRSQAQCPTEGISFGTQAQLDYFIQQYPTCTNLPGNLEIASGDITNLNALSNITSIGGNLSIHNCTSLTSLNGLNALTSVGGGIYIADYNTLSNLTGLNAVTSIGGDLVITNIPKLKNLSALNAVTSVGGSLQISGIPLLQSLEDLNAVTTVGGNLQIYSNDHLQNINSLNAVTTIGGRLQIAGDSLLHVNGLSALTSVGGDLEFGGNILLQDINGLAALTHIGGTLRIDNNASLQNLYGLSNLTYVGQYLTITNSSLLQNLSGLNSLTHIGGFISITSNPQLQNLNGLGNLKSIGGELRISLNPVLQNLNGLNALNLIGGAVRVTANAQLNDISGLRNINSFTIQNLQIGNNPNVSVCNMPNFCEFIAANPGYGNIESNAGNCISMQAVINACQVTCPTGDKEFTNQEQVNQFVSAYTHCTNITFKNLTIRGNDITNISGLTNIKTITGSLRIESNNVLTNLTGLSGITSVGGSLTIQSNPSLDNLNGLLNITNIGDTLRIQANAVLVNITGITNINPATISVLIINNNPQLAICKYPNICTYLDYDPFIKQRAISFNKTTCLDLATVIDVCSDNSITLCPNSSTSISSSISGTNYQWQVNKGDGNGFTIISNGGYYSGAGTSQLHLTNIPSSFYGDRFRCLVDGNYTRSTILKFSVTWNGNQSSSWETALNWGCNVVPDAYTDVIIPPGSGPVEVHSSSIIRSLDMQPGTNFKIVTGSHLYVAH